MNTESDNILWHQHNVTKKNRSIQKKQQPCILWLGSRGNSEIIVRY